MDIYLDNKYTKWYYSIISKAQNRKQLDGYSEKHHIIPRSLGGSDRKFNLVSLTAREHYICHLLLTKMVEGENAKKMRYGYLAMTTLKNEGHYRDFKVNSRLFESIRKNIKMTEETKRKISLANKGRPCKYKGIKRPKEVNLKNSDAIKEWWKKRKEDGSFKTKEERPIHTEIINFRNECIERYGSWVWCKRGYKMKQGSHRKSDEFLSGVLQNMKKFVELNHDNLIGSKGKNNE
jgi:hypothetical protein